MRRLIPINRRQNVFLVENGHGDDERLARLFSETPKRIPLGARRRMYKHWRHSFYRTASAVRRTKSVRSSNGELVNRMCVISPQVELLGGWKDKIVSGAEEHGGEYGLCTGAGHCFWFHPASVDRMPDAVVQSLIAHELAHVYRFACGEFGSAPLGSIDLDEEEAARDLEAQRGFDPCAVWDWEEDPDG